MNTRSLLLCAFFLIALCASTPAQEPPPFEVFGGYSLVRPSGGGNLHGWNSGVAVNLNRTFGIVGEVSGNYGRQSFRAEIARDPFPPITAKVGSHSSLYFMLLGPRFSYRRDERVIPSAHLLVGAARLSTSATSTLGPLVQDTEFADIGFAIAVGGAIDLRLTESISFRALQADFVRTRLGGGTQNSLRLSVGLVFH